MSVDWSQLEDLYQQGIESLAIKSLPEFCHYQAYLQRLIKWNKVYNLTAIREPEAMLKQHVLESLAVLPYLSGDTRLDIGTGAGIPGVILAMAEPQAEWHLLDSNSKKTRFVQQVVIELELKNVTVHHQRIEEHAMQAAYELIISRAFTDVAEFYALSKDFLKEHGRMLAMKRGKPEQELNALNQQGIRHQFHYLSVLGNQEAASVIEIMS